jgi:hypothetical protein
MALVTCDDAAAEALAVSLMDNHTIKKVLIYGNYMNSHGIVLLLKAVEYHASLESLDISDAAEFGQDAPMVKNAPKLQVSTGSVPCTMSESLRHVPFSTDCDTIHHSSFSF